MKRLRELFVLLALAASFGFALFMLETGAHLSLASPWMGIMVMFCVLGLIGFARPFFLLPLPVRLRNVHRWENAGSRYRVPGVKAFSWLLRRTPLRLANPEAHLNYGAQDPVTVNTQLEAAEAAHYLAAALLIPYMIHALWEGQWLAEIGLSLVQVVINVYPICHLRWVRGRLARVFNRREFRHRATPRVP